MRNKYAGTCYRCGEHCAAGDGHFERFGQGFRVQHASCAIEHRGTPDPAREALKLRNMRARAAGTGKRAQRARKALREIENVAAPINLEDF
jgi:hypothetical protein